MERLDTCERGAPLRYLKYKNGEALWAHVCRQAVDVMPTVAE